MIFGLDPTQLTTTLATAVVLYFQYAQVKINREVWRWELPIAVWMVLQFAFYIAVAIDGLNIIDVHDIFGPTIFTSISAILRLVSVFAIAGLEYTRYRMAKDAKAHDVK
jgi:hypothetical protein